MSRQFTRLAFVTSVSIWAWGQQSLPQREPFDTDHIKRVQSNTSKLRITMSLDRTAYFPREEGLLKVTVTNPEPEPMEVFQLWNPASTDFVFSYEEPERAPTDLRSMPTELIRANSESTRFLEISPLSCIKRKAERGIGMLLCSMPPVFGKHVLGLRIAGMFRAQAYFEVIDPGSNFEVVDVEVDQRVEPSLDVFGRPTGRMLRSRAYSRIYRLERNGEQCLCVLRGSTVLSLDESRTRNLLLLQGPLSCVYSSKHPITQLRLNRDAEGGIALQFANGGRQMQMRFDRDRRRIEER
jgi:hypothetical protein